MILAVSLTLAVLLAACDTSENDEADPATSTQIENTDSPRYAGGRELNGGRSVRAVARSYCGGEGQIGDFARILGLPRQTRDLDRIAREYGTRLAANLNRDEVTGSPARSEIRSAVYEGCLAGLREKREG